MIPSVFGDTATEPTRDPWTGWARVVDPPEPIVAPGPSAQAAEAEPALVAEAAPVLDLAELATAVARLADELADERRLREVADDGRREAEARAYAAEAEAAAARARIAELERDRDDVILRAEELLTAVRERADQRLAEERVRADELALRMQDAWLAAAVLRRARPLKPRASTPASVVGAEEEALEALEENEVDPSLAEESPELAGEIDQLRERLRSRLHKPPDITTVEDSVEDLRAARLARDAKRAGHRKK